MTDFIEVTLYNPLIWLVVGAGVYFVLLEELSKHRKKPWAKKSTPPK
jgi:hypothetical protein